MTGWDPAAVRRIGTGMSNRELIAQVTEWASPIAADLGLRLVDVEFQPAGKRSVLRVFLDREGGVGLDELARASHEIEAVLDVRDAVPGTYSLECSSPGINRRLKGRADFEQHLGQRVRLRTWEALSGSRNFLGEIESVHTEEIVLVPEGADAIRIPLAAIEKANYEHDFDAEARERR